MPDKVHDGAHYGIGNQARQMLFTHAKNAVKIPHCRE
jgi:hypothetical protein